MAQYRADIMMVVEAVGKYSHYSNDITDRFFSIIDNEIKNQMKEDVHTGYMDVNNRYLSDQTDLIKGMYIGSEMSDKKISKSRKLIHNTVKKTSNSPPLSCITISTYERTVTKYKQIEKKILFLPVI